MAAHLQLYGPVSWSLDGRRVPIGGSVRVGVALRLAEADGATVSVESLLTDLWSKPPRSGANAVQRHISALRRQLGDLGVEDPASIIQRVPGGYRLKQTTSDLTQLNQLLQANDIELEEVPWWEEPLVGAPWEQTRTLRTRLELLAEQALAKWSAGLPSERTGELGTRAEHMTRHTPGCREAARIKARSKKRLRQADRELLTEPGLSTVREAIGLWSDGRGNDALDLLETGSSVVPRDLARRLNRSLIWLDPDELWACHILSTVVEDAVTSPEQYERSVVTLDARALEEHPDGTAVARVEIQEASSVQERVRALRVAIMLGLSSPHSAAQDELIEQLATVQSPDAQVEAARFAFLSGLRRCELDEANLRLDDYANAVRDHWPGSGDDFALMARAALQRSPDPEVAAAFGPIRPSIGGFAADRWVLPIADTIRRLVALTAGEGFVPDTEFFVAVSPMSTIARTAMRLLRDYRQGAPTTDRARTLAEALPTVTREKQFMLGPIAVAVHAESLQDKALATAASESIEPWSGQMLGIWPVDSCLGPADRWLDRMAAI